MHPVTFIALGLAGYLGYRWWGGRKAEQATTAPKLTPKPMPFTSAPISAPPVAAPRVVAPQDVPNMNRLIYLREQRDQHPDQFVPGRGGLAELLKLEAWAQAHGY